tara:strand:- start:559 stop:744 length:186 start_codon:yes stop_codon:yes gene_type:complete
LELVINTNIMKYKILIIFIICFLGITYIAKNYLEMNIAYPGMVVAAIVAWLASKKKSTVKE